MKIRCALCDQTVTEVPWLPTAGERVLAMIEVARHLRDVHGDEEGALDLERTAIGTMGPKRT